MLLHPQGPIKVGVFVKNSVYIRVTKNEKPYRFSSRHRQHGCSDRKRYLVLHHLRCLSWVRRFTITCTSDNRARHQLGYSLKNPKAANIKGSNTKKRLPLTNGSRLLVHFSLQLAHGHDVKNHELTVRNLKVKCTSSSLCKLDISMRGEK